MLQRTDESTTNLIILEQKLYEYHIIIITKSNDVQDLDVCACLRILLKIRKKTMKKVRKLKRNNWKVCEFKYDHTPTSSASDSCIKWCEWIQKHQKCKKKSWTVTSMKIEIKLTILRVRLQHMIKKFRSSLSDAYWIQSPTQPTVESNVYEYGLLQQVQVFIFLHKFVCGEAN